MVKVIGQKIIFGGWSRNLRLGLRVQIALLGIVGVLLTGATCLVGLQYGAIAQFESEQSVTLRLHVIELSSSYLEAGLVANGFLRKPDEKLIETHKRIVEGAQSHLQKIEALAGNLDDANLAKQAAGLIAGLNLYTTRFGNIVSAQRILGLNENQGLQGKLRQAVHEIESKLEGTTEPRLSVLMLMMRRHEKDFILRGQEKYGDEVLQRVTEFEDALNASVLASDVKKDLKALVRSYKSGFVAFMVSQTGLNDEVDDFTTIFQRNRPTLDALSKLTAAHYQSSEARAVQFRQYLVWIICAATLGIGLFSFYFGRRIAKSIARMTVAMQKLASGEFDAVLPGLQRRDEVGDMARAVETFKTKARQAALDEASAKAFQEQAEADRRKLTMNNLADEFEIGAGKIIETVFSAAAKLESSAGSLTATAVSSQKLTGEVAAASGDVISNVQSVASATKQLSSSVYEISRQIHETGRIATQAAQQTARTDNHIRELANAGDRIGNIVDVIHAIARQTNLLALNATIEAARAGESGRGFAVVAFEVKALAEQTARATADIHKHVNEIQAATRVSADSIGEIIFTIGRISEISSTIASAVEQQDAATREISLSMQKVAEETSYVGSSIADIQRGATQTERSSIEVFSASKSLSNDSELLREQVGKFLYSVRAA